MLTWLGGCDGAAEQSAGADDGAVTRAAIDASLAAAQDYLVAGSAVEAEAVLAVLVDRAPLEPRAWELYGQVLAFRAVEARAAETDETVRSLFGKAHDCYRRAAELEPDSAGLQQSAGEIAHSAGRLDEALAHYERAAELAPTDSKPPLYAAQVLIERGQPDRARQRLREVLVIDPDEPYAHASLALISLDAGDYEPALRHMGEARRISPDHVVFRAQHARILRRAGRCDEALALLAHLDEAARSAEIVTAELAACHARRGEHEQAAAAWELCYERGADPGRRWLAAVRAGQARLDAAQRGAARRWLDRAQLEAPHEPEVEALESAMAR